tara:strand:+ start:93130 stop:93234 length:105 start_codon:yes stop_codon:yes gene_type:complete
MIRSLDEIPCADETINQQIAERNKESNKLIGEER